MKDADIALHERMQLMEVAFNLKFDILIYFLGYIII